MRMGSITANHTIKGTIFLFHFPVRCKNGENPAVHHLIASKGTHLTGLWTGSAFRPLHFTIQTTSLHYSDHFTFSLRYSLILKLKVSSIYTQYPMMTKKKQVCKFILKKPAIPFLHKYSDPLL
jgi:hypothetical protein